MTGINPVPGICLTLPKDNDKLIDHTIEGFIHAGGICGQLLYCLPLCSHGLPASPFLLRGPVAGKNGQFEKHRSL